MELRRVCKSFGRNRVLADVSVSIHKGETLAVVGANGAGKTTLLRIVAGLVRPDHGVVSRTRWGQEDDVVAYFAGGASVPPNLTARRLLGLFKAQVPEHLPAGQRLSRASRGTRQQVGLLAVLAREHCREWVLDEPWDGLDPIATARVHQALIARRCRGGSTLIASHRLHELVGVATHFATLVRGSLRIHRALSQASSPEAVVGELIEALQ
ncbi:MAG: ATP-binding cassette domain-containing protein [Vicinamibacterales bacterium]|nr:ATP-binding cassette domain-containing protein [Vicinamibacterales bacterium]